MNNLVSSFLFTLIFLFIADYSVSQIKSRPNILWIISEDMSQDQGCYGNSLVKTPTIDKLASDGMRFTHMFTVAAVCAPSRTAIATGMYQTSIDAMHMRYSEELMNPLPEGVKTIAHILEGHGYQTYLGGKKNDYSFRLNTPSFQFQDIDKLEKGKPFFAKVNSFYTHRGFRDDTENPVDPSLIKLPPYYPDVRPLREDWAAYYENIQLLDNEVDQILSDFEERGLLENTIIFFFSDHGRPMLRGKYWMYDSGIRIPFIVYIPEGVEIPNGYLSGAVNNQLHSSIDISATTLALAGVEKPAYMQGQVFLGDQKEPERNYVYGSADRIGGIYLKTRSVRNQKYKYIRNFNNGWSILECTTEYRKTRLPHYITISILDNYNKLNEVQKTLVNPMPMEELYDIENDPCEINNLAYKNDYQDIREELETVLMNWIEEIDDKAFQPDSPSIQKHFIDYRARDKEIYRKEKLKNYLVIEKQLKEDNVIY